jgi:hypothetical protein
LLLNRISPEGLIVGSLTTKTTTTTIIIIITTTYEKYGHK